MNKVIIMLRGAVFLLRAISHVIRIWPIVAIVLYFVVDGPVPHLQLVGTYHGYRYYPNLCTYVGPEGLVDKPNRPYGCPLLLMINPETGDVP